MDSHEPSIYVSVSPYERGPDDDRYFPVYLNFTRRGTAHAEFVTADVARDLAMQLMIAANEADEKAGKRVSSVVPVSSSGHSDGTEPSATVAAQQQT